MCASSVFVADVYTHTSLKQWSVRSDIAQPICHGKTAQPGRPRSNCTRAAGVSGLSCSIIKGSSASDHVEQDWTYCPHVCCATTDKAGSWLSTSVKSSAGLKQL